jgi:hypothetical protein
MTAIANFRGLDATYFDTLTPKQQVLELLNVLTQIVCHDTTSNREYCDYGTIGHDKVLENAEALEQSINKYIDA